MKIYDYPEKDCNRDTHYAVFFLIPWST